MCTLTGTLLSGGCSRSRRTTILARDFATEVCMKAKLVGTRSTWASQATFHCSDWSVSWGLWYVLLGVQHKRWPYERLVSFVAQK